MKSIAVHPTTSVLLVMLVATIVAVSKGEALFFFFKRALYLSDKNVLQNLPVHVGF